MHVGATSRVKVPTLSAGSRGPRPSTSLGEQQAGGLQRSPPVSMSHGSVVAAVCEMRARLDAAG